MQDIDMEIEDVTLKFLREVTDDFSKERIIGEGAFGVVYKGVTKNGDDVAVKKLKLRDVNLDLKQFQNELYNLTKLKHPNIVRILGYCYEIEKKPLFMDDGREVLVDKPYLALCFEYLHNGSLQKHLSDEFCKFDWHKRFKIIKGICDGLKYIHKDLQPHIYHFDLKPDNILLDKDMVPKIADFGLSRIFGNELARVTQQPYGTLGYQPPEYLEKSEISEMFDIFSLGVIIIRIVSGPKDYPDCQDMSSHKYINQVRIDWRNRLQATCTGDSLEAYCHQVETCTQIALDCVQKDSQKRPDIIKITEKLNELEIHNGKFPQKGCHKIEMGTKSNYITDPHHNSNLCSGPSCSELELFFDAPETSSDVVEEIIGRTEEKEKVMMDFLVKAMLEKIAILPIYGIGGIGKTTFARLIYNHPKFKHYSQVWVNVSQRFDLNKIRESIISQLSSKESLTNERQMVHCCLSELLSHKKVLIVLDNIWEEDQLKLQALQDMLYCDDSNIIILVTTRSERVADKICTNLKPYKILPLTDDMCWNIIKQRCAFEDRDDKEQLIGIGREIAQKCGGVALAARSLGFTLRSTKNFAQWTKVKDSDIWNEPVSKDTSSPNHVLASLKLSYSYMPPCLKQCFTYCAIFPKGHKIVKDDLIYQWISLDFIKPTKLHSTMELCDKYIGQLLGLSFLQQPLSPKTSEAFYKQATFFNMHDLVLDLAISLLGNDILDQSKQGHIQGSSCKYALLADCSKPMASWTTSPAALRALRFLDNCRTEISGAAFAPARSLLVLDLSECFIHRLPNSIGQLKQLRYLNVAGIEDEMVPECITKLSNLIYLNLHKYFRCLTRTLQLPESIGDMGSLMHLDLSACIIERLPVSFRNLERLVHLDLSSCDGISGVPELLQSMSRLEHLNLSRCGRIGDVTRIRNLKELQYLNLSDSTCFGLQVLANLTKLRYLNLERSLNLDFRRNSFLECVSNLSNLEYLNLRCNGNLCAIPETIGNLTKLHTLDLSYCDDLQRLPDSLSRIDSLKFLHVYGCSKLDKSTLPQNKNGSALLPHFVVHARDGESSSNLSELEDKHLTFLEINRLENVKNAKEAQAIKLAQKLSIKELQLAWTKRANGLVDDAEVLRELVPPDTVERFMLRGYNGISFPSWMMGTASYLHLRKVVMEDLPKCNVLPPLGQLPNLMWLEIGGMDSITKIDADFYGGTRAFARLMDFSLHHMECLEEWNTPKSGCEDGLFNELVVFPELIRFTIDCCPLLRFKASSPPGKGDLFISRSDQVLLSSWGNRCDTSASSSAATTRLFVTHCVAPLRQWSLLRHLPCLQHLEINDCSDLTYSSTDLFRRISSLTIRNCNGIKTLPEIIQQLTCLQRLQIDGCPELVQWCKSTENKMKLTHINDTVRALPIYTL